MPNLEDLAYLNKKQMARIGQHISVNILFFLWMFLVKVEMLGVKGAFLHTSLNWGMWVVLFYAHGHFLVNPFFESKKYGHFAIGSMVLITIYLLIRFNVTDPLLASVYRVEDILRPERIRYSIIMMSFLVLIFSTLFHLLVNRYRKEKTNQLLIQEHQAAELQFLKAQINPHFLFNTLNNIYSLSIIQSPKTPQMVLQLSQLLRYVLYESQNKKVSLSGELTQIEKYIALFQLKNETPVNIQLEKEGSINGQKIEPMMLIPLVENALKHCDFDTNEKAYARIAIHTEGDTLHFSTINSKNDANQQKDEVGGVGLKNIRKRLALNYPNQHELVINNLEYAFEVRLKIRMMV